MGGSEIRRNQKKQGGKEGRKEGKEGKETNSIAYLQRHPKTRVHGVFNGVHDLQWLLHVWVAGAVLPENYSFESVEIAFIIIY